MLYIHLSLTLGVLCTLSLDYHSFVHAFIRIELVVLKWHNKANAWTALLCLLIHSYLINLCVQWNKRQCHMSMAFCVHSMQSLYRVGDGRCIFIGCLQCVHLNHRISIICLSIIRVVFHKELERFISIVDL